jgi:hypothetical protein
MKSVISGNFKSVMTRVTVFYHGFANTDYFVPGEVCSDEIKILKNTSNWPAEIS